MQETVLLLSAQPRLSSTVAKLMADCFPDLLFQIAGCGETGLQRIYQCPPKVIFIDSMLPDVSGLQVARVLKHDSVIRKVPIILIIHDDAADYLRFNELSLIADSIVEARNVKTDLPGQVTMLLKLFSSLSAPELEQLDLLRRQPVQAIASSRLLQLLDQSLTTAALMERFRELLADIPTTNRLNHQLFGLLETVLDFDVAGIFFNDPNRDPRLLTYYVSEQAAADTEQIQALTETVFADLRKLDQSPWRFEVTRSEMLYPDYPNRPVKPVTVKSHQVYPFFMDNRLLGALVFLNRKPVPYEMIFPFSMLLEELNALMRLRYYYSEAQMLSICDAWTGLYAHHHFTWCLEREIHQSRRHKLPLTLACMRIENIRELNTQWGYAMGDAALKQAAQISLETVRSIDMLARAGSSTIIGLFPNTGLSDAQIIVERIQNQLVQTPLIWENKSIPLQLSTGMVVLTDDIPDSAVFISKAEAALEAKKSLRAGKLSAQPRTKTSKQ